MGSHPPPSTLPTASARAELAQLLGLSVDQVTTALAALYAGEMQKTARFVSGLSENHIQALGRTVGWNPSWRKRRPLAHERDWHISTEEVLRLDDAGTPYADIGARAGVTGEAVRQLLLAHGRGQRRESMRARRVAAEERARAQRLLDDERARAAQAEDLALIRTFLEPATHWYAQGWTYRAIAAELGITRVRLAFLIAKCRDRLGEDIFPKRVATPGAPSSQEKLRTRMEPVRALYARGASIDDIAQALGCTRAQTQWLITRCRYTLGPEWFPLRHQHARRTGVMVKATSSSA